MGNAQLKTVKLLLLYFQQILASSQMLSDTESNNAECSPSLKAKSMMLCRVLSHGALLCGSISLCVKEHHQREKGKSDSKSRAVLKR